MAWATPVEILNSGAQMFSRDAAGTGNVTGSCSQTVAVGDLLIANIAASTVSSLDAGFSMTDNLGNTWLVADHGINGANLQGTILSSRVSVAGTLTTLTLAMTNSCGRINGNLVLVAGGLVASGTYIDVVAHSTGTSTTPSSGATATIANANSLAFAQFVHAKAQTFSSQSWGTRLTSSSSNAGTTDKAQEGTYNAAVGTAATTATETISGSTAWYASVVVFIPATGTAWTQTPTDNTGLTDSSVIEHGYGNVTTDNTGLTDSFTVSMDYARPTTDSAGLTDSATLSMGYVRNQTDDTGLTDQAVLSRGINQSYSDAVGLTDQVVITHDYVLVIMDSVGITEVNTESPSDLRPVDAIGITDTAILQIIGGTVAGSIMDQIMVHVTGLGFTVGTVQDRERARLVAATGKDAGYTIDDLYKANGERNRIALESVAILPII